MMISLSGIKRSATIAYEATGLSSHVKRSSLSDVTANNSSMTSCSNRDEEEMTGLQLASAGRYSNKREVARN